MKELKALAEKYNVPESDLTERFNLMIARAKTKVLGFMEMELKAGKQINVELYIKNCD